MLFPHIDAPPGEKLLEVERLTLANGVVNDVSFYARAGEITGDRRARRLRQIRARPGGLRPGARSRRAPIRVDGASRRRARRRRRCCKRGLCYFPSDRVAEGLALGRPVRENGSMAALDLPAFARGGVLRRAGERRAMQGIVDRLKLRPPHIERAVANFSGGNRQKVLLARGLTRDINVYLFDEPTVGIDVGAKMEVYELMKDLVATGAAIVLVSSELPEVMNLSHRLYVMHRSRMVAELTGADINEPAVLSHFFREDPRRSRPRRRRSADDVAGDFPERRVALVRRRALSRVYDRVGFLPTMLVAAGRRARAVRAAISSRCRTYSTCCAPPPIWSSFRRGRCSC